MGAEWKIVPGVADFMAAWDAHADEQNGWAHLAGDQRDMIATMFKCGAAWARRNMPSAAHDAQGEPGNATDQATATILRLMQEMENLIGRLFRSWEREQETQGHVVSILEKLAKATARAEIAEDRVKALEVALGRIDATGRDGEHSGDRHAKCRAIARAALASDPK